MDHNIIIAKRAVYGVPDILLRWVGSFLGDRRQRTRIGQEVSDWLHLNGSVSQASGLGPFLYVVVINDLVANGLLLHKFMDDSAVTETIDNPAESKMQVASDIVVKWTEENNRINGVKTKEMIITFQNNPPPIPPLNMNGTVIERVKSSKLLEIIISDDLKWHLHVDSICSKASCRIHFVSRLGRSGMEHLELVQYHTSVIRSVLEYACPAWFTSVKHTGHMWELELIQIRS